MNLRRRAATALDELARAAGRLADRIDPPHAPPAVVEDGYAQGRADLQLVHDAVEADLTARAQRIRDRARTIRPLSCDPTPSEAGK